MTASPRGSGSIAPLVQNSSAVGVGLNLVAGILGTMSILFAYLAFSASLPSSISSSGPGAPAAAALPTTLFVTLGVGLDAALTAVFTVLSRAISPSHVLVHQYGPGLRFSILGAGVVVPLGILPFAWIATLARAAGVWPAGWPTALDLLPFLVVIPILVFVVLPLAWVTLRRSSEPGAGAPEGEGRYVLRCSSCGETFRRPTLPAWTLQIGVSRFPGKTSYHLRCPRCGDRGWDLLVDIAEEARPSR